MLTTLQLISFRNHERLLLDFEPFTLIVGNNAVGKTNILEAISLLSTGDSFRAGRIEEMVKWEEEVGHVIGKVKSLKSTAGSTIHEDEEELSLHVTVTRGVVQGKRVMKRLYKVNGTGKHKQDFVGLLPSVLFRPEDMSLLAGEPSGRRKFLDSVLVQVDKEYGRSLAAYEKALVRRNKLLSLIREGQVSRTTLMFWDQILIKDGNIITRKREALIDWINAVPARSGELVIQYDRSSISESRLLEYAQAELAMGHTLVGPHKDDFKVLDKARDISVYGSRGEQRMAVMWLKEAQMIVMEKILGSRPLLLLDDILSELDRIHEQDVLELAKQQQTILTTTEEELKQNISKEVKLIHL